MFRRSDDPLARQLRRHLGALRRRLWLERAARLGTRALVLGFGVALAAAVVAWSTITPLDPTYYGGPVVASLALALLVSLFRYPSPMEAARTADHRLALREKLGTAVELIGAGRGRTPRNPFAHRQLATAIEAADWARQHWRPARGTGRGLGLAAALGLATVGMLLLTGLDERLPQPIPRPSAWSLLPRQDPSAEQAAPEPAPSAAEPTVSPDQGGPTAAVTRAIDDLRRARESGTIGAGEAANRLAQAESELSRQTGESRAQREALDRLGQALDQVAAGAPAAENIQRGDYDGAGEEIGKLGTESDQLSPQAKSQLAQALRSAAGESPSSPELAAKERRAADALAGRDYEAARRAMEDLGEEVARRGRDVVPQQELARAWDQVDQERRRQGRAESAARQGQDPASGQRQAGSEGAQRSAQASGQGAENRASGQGSGAGNESGGGGEDGEGSGDGGDASGRVAGPPAGAESVGTFQPAGQAARLDVQGRPVEVDVKPGQRSGQRPGDPEQEDPNRQDSDEVGGVSSVSGQAPRAITSAAPAESNFVPTDRRQVVRDYFSPEGGTR